jgi:hypothetical protein
VAKKLKWHQLVCCNNKVIKKVNLRKVSIFNFQYFDLFINDFRVLNKTLNIFVIYSIKINSHDHDQKLLLINNLGCNHVS